MTLRSRPVWPLLTAALIGLSVLYVGSFAPAVSYSRANLPSCRFVDLAYYPLWHATFNGPEWCREALLAYLDFRGISFKGCGT